MTGLLIASLLLAAPPDTGSPESRADVLVARGAALGKSGRYEEAIGRFREAESLFPRAIHQCNIALAYRLWKRWPAAQLYFQRCTARATDRLPSWVRREQRRVRGKLRSGYAPVEVHARPSGATVRLVQGVTGDDRFATPLTLWVAHGEVVTLHIELAGYESVTREVAGGKLKEVVRVSIELEELPKPAPSVVRIQPALPVAIPVIAKPVPVEPIPPKSSNVAGWATLGAGVAAAGLGAVFHALASDRRMNLGSMPAGTEFDSGLSSFELERGLAIGMYAAGAAVISVAVYLLAGSD